MQTALVSLFPGTSIDASFRLTPVELSLQFDLVVTHFSRTALGDVSGWRLAKEGLRLSEETSGSLGREGRPGVMTGRWASRKSAGRRCACSLVQNLRCAHLTVTRSGRVSSSLWGILNCVLKAELHPRGQEWRKDPREAVDPTAPSLRGTLYWVSRGGSLQAPPCSVTPAPAHASTTVTRGPGPGGSPTFCWLGHRLRHLG